MDDAANFCDALADYFGPWRGDGTQAQIVKWLRAKRIPKRALLYVYSRLLEDHEVEPVNTISVKTIDRLLASYVPEPADAKQIEAPDEGYLPREEAAKKLREILTGLTGRSA